MVRALLDLVEGDGVAAHLGVEGGQDVVDMRLADPVAGPTRPVEGVP